MTARRAACTLAALVTAVAGAACGSSAPDHLSSGARAELDGTVRAIRVAVAAHDPARARAAVGKFQSQVRTLRDAGRLNESDAKALDTQAAQVDARIAIEVKPVTAVTAPTSSTAISPAPPPTKASPAKPPHPGQDKGNGKGKDHGHGGD